jgi:hypothetical protein
MVDRFEARPGATVDGRRDTEPEPEAVFTSWAPPVESRDEDLTPVQGASTADDTAVSWAEAVASVAAPAPVAASVAVAHDRSAVEAVPPVSAPPLEPPALELPVSVPLEPPVLPPPAPAVSVWERWRRRRPRVRKVSRVVRRVDAWSVFKVGLVFWLVAYAVGMVSGVLLWNLADTTGTTANVEGFIRELFALESFSIQGDVVFRAAVWLGIVLVLAGTAAGVVGAVLFNLITDLVGGIRVTVLEEEVVLRADPTPDAAGPTIEGGSG